MNADEVDDWTAFFKDRKPSDRRGEREARAKQERRTQLTEKQRERSGAIRTEQINFRCSAAFKAKVNAMKKHKGADRSIADVLEQALDLLAKSEGFND
jgi:hypothetical protein